MTPPRVAVVRLQGVIASGGRGTLNFASLEPVLDRAFTKGSPAAVALVINSPGGSPVQSSLIVKHIRRLSEEKEIPVYAFVEDVAASGGYWLATAGDEIYADLSSIIGSIGVISAGFGFHELIAKHGIERRVHTAGVSKSTNDPFKPQDPDDVAKLNTVLEEIHNAFKLHVAMRRGSHLDGSTDIYTGAYWTALPAKELGLIDGIDDVTHKMKNLFGDNVKFIRHGVKKPLLRRFGAQLMDDAIISVEERAEYARFGL